MHFGELASVRSRGQRVVGELRGMRSPGSRDPAPMAPARESAGNTPPWHDRPMTYRALQRVAGDLRSALSGLEPERLSGPDAARLLERFAEIEKLAAGGKLLITT